MLISFFIAVGFFTPLHAFASAEDLRKLLENRQKLTAHKAAPSVVFDLPVTYNKRVSFWIQYFTGKGRNWYQSSLERGTKYLPFLQKELKAQGLPQDLAYIVMIESGFEANAISRSAAVGPWQFIQSTGERYGLKINYWIDERRDWKKSTQAAIRYLKDLNGEFGSWYLAAASYNMGENGLRRQMQRYNTKDFWALSRIGAIPQETIDYVPKILAALMLSKAPTIYGFNSVAQFEPLNYDIVYAPGGTQLHHLADHLKVTPKSLTDLNAELILGYIPSHIQSHAIRIPKGTLSLVTRYFSNKRSQQARTENQDSSVRVSQTEESTVLR